MNLREWIADQSVGTKALNLRTDEARAAYWRRVERQRAPFERWATKQIAAQFRREMRGVVASGELKSAAQWAKPLRAIHLRTATAFAQTTMAALKPRKQKADLWQQFVLDAIEEWTAALVQQITETTRDQIKRAIAEGMAAGEGAYEVTQRIRRLYLDDIIPRRAEVIARTEVIRASSAGSLAAAKATRESTGLKLEKVWIRTFDNRVRPSHAAAGGQQVQLDEPFIVGGSRLMHPGDSSLGAPASETVLCRCALAYVETH